MDKFGLSKTLTRQEFANLWNQLQDLPIIFKLDVIHFEELTNNELKKEILATGIEFN